MQAKAKMLRNQSLTQSKLSRPLQSTRRRNPLETRERQAGLSHFSDGQSFGAQGLLGTVQRTYIHTWYIHPFCSGNHLWVTYILEKLWQSGDWPSQFCHHEVNIGQLTLRLWKNSETNVIYCMIC